MNEGLFAIVLMLVGIGILFAEIFIPSGGVITIMAVACLGASVYSAWEAWWGVNPSYFWTYILSMVVLIPLSIVMALWLLERTSWGDRMLLDAPDPDDVDSYREERDHLQTLVGKVGTAATLMTPGGIVVVGGERLHAETEGVLLDPGTEIEVVAVRGTRLLVREHTGFARSEPAVASDPTFTQVATAEDPPSTAADFDSDALAETQPMSGAPVVAESFDVDVPDEDAVDTLPEQTDEPEATVLDDAPPDSENPLDLFLPLTEGGSEPDSERQATPPGDFDIPDDSVHNSRDTSA